MKEGQVHKRIFIQPSETIPRTMRQRGITSEPNEMEYVQGECDTGQTGGLNDTSAIELQTRKRVITQPTETIPRKMRQRGDENEPKEMEYVQGDMNQTGGMLGNVVVNATSAIEHEMLRTSATELKEQGGDFTTQRQDGDWSPEASEVFSGRVDQPFAKPQEC